MQDDDDLPKTPRKRLQPPLLDPMGVAELRAYIEELQAEIARVEAEITRKATHRSAADSVFRKP